MRTTDCSILAQCNRSLGRGQEAEAGVAAPAVVEGFHVLEERPPGCLPAREAGAMHKLVLEAAEEALHGRVVQAVPAPAHRAAQAVAGQDRLIGLAGVLHATDALLC